MITRELYRAHMNRYAHETCIMSMTVYKHHDYRALLAMGEEIIPFLLEDIQAQDPEGSWSGTDEYWFSFWSGLELFFTLVGDNRPVIPEEIRGRLKPLRQLCVDWGIERGYLASESKPKLWYAWKPWRKE